MNAQEIQRKELAGKTKLTAVTVYISPGRKSTAQEDRQALPPGETFLCALGLDGLHTLVEPGDLHHQRGLSVPFQEDVGELVDRVPDRLHVLHEADQGLLHLVIGHRHPSSVTILSS